MRFVAATVLVSGRFVYSKNPLYVVSALLVLWGLWISFDTSAPWFTSGALMIGLAFYTLLLAGTAVLLIRAGQVWEDVRTLLLLVVLMLLAISVSFDAFPVTSAVAGCVYSIVGLIVAAAVSELLLYFARLAAAGGLPRAVSSGIGAVFLVPARADALLG